MFQLPLKHELFVEQLMPDPNWYIEFIKTLSKGPLVPADGLSIQSCSPTTESSDKQGLRS